MSRVVIDDETLKKLGGLKQPVELCDEQGRLIGRVFPSGLADMRWEPTVSEEELRRREASTEVLSTEEVKRRLGMA